MYLFEEALATFMERCSSMGLNVRSFVDSGHITLRQVDPAEMSAGEFANELRQAVEAGDTRLVVIDSLNGYLNAMPTEKYLVLHLHELLTYLGQKGVSTLLLLAQHGFVSPDASAPVDASYLADTAILIRYFEAFGVVRQAISVMKKRTGKHERTIRELRFDDGIQVGAPLRNFQGLLAGHPRFVGESGEIASAYDGKHFGA
jgi:circadian clock protein KaiC